MSFYCNCHRQGKESPMGHHKEKQSKRTAFFMSSEIRSRLLRPRSLCSSAIKVLIALMNYATRPFPQKLCFSGTPFLGRSVYHIIRRSTYTVKSPLFLVFFFLGYFYTELTVLILFIVCHFFKNLYKLGDFDFVVFVE